MIEYKFWWRKQIVQNVILLYIYVTFTRHLKRGTLDKWGFMLQKETKGWLQPSFFVSFKWWNGEKKRARGEVAEIGENVKNVLKIDYVTLLRNNYVTKSWFQKVVNLPLYDVKKYTCFVKYIKWYNNLLLIFNVLGRRKNEKQAKKDARGDISFSAS